MNFKTTLVLILLAAVVAGYFVLMELGTLSPRERARKAQSQGGSPGAALFTDHNLEPDSITCLRIERADAPAVVLERSDDQWHQVEPVRFPLDTERVRPLLRAATELRSIDRFQPSTDSEDNAPTRASVGLEPPRLTLAIESENERITLHLGDRSLGSNGYLALENDPHVYIVQDALHRRLLDQTVNDWRRRRLESPDITALGQINLNRREGRIALSRVDGQWTIDSAPPQRASRAAIQRVVDAVQDARIEAFVADQPDSLSRFGLAEPRLTCTLRTAASPSTDETNHEAQATTHTLRIGLPTDLRNEQFFATWSQNDQQPAVVFTLSAADIEPLEVELDELRDPRLLTTGAREIKAIKVERPNQPNLQLLRDVNQGFVFGEPDPGYDMDYDAATALFEALATAEATGYRTDFTPTDDPMALITVTQRGSEATETLRLYRAESSEDERAYLSVRENEPVAYRVTHESLAELFKPTLALRDRELLAVDPANVAQVVLKRDDGATFTFNRQTESDGAPAGWTLESGDAFEQDAFDALLDDLSPLRVERWLTDGPVEPGEDWCALTVRMRDGATHVLRVDPQTRHGVLAGIEPGFVLPNAVTERLTAEYRPRTILSASSDEIASVTVQVSDTEPVILQRDAEDRYVSNSGQSMNQSRAGALFDALAGLKVERYVEPDAEANQRLGPVRRVTVALQDGRTHELVIHGENDGRGARFAALDGRPFRLRPRDHDRLTATIIADANESESENADVYK